MILKRPFRFLFKHEKALKNANDIFLTVKQELGSSGVPKRLSWMSGSTANSVRQKLTEYDHSEAGLARLLNDPLMRTVFFGYGLRKMESLILRKL